MRIEIFTDGSATVATKPGGWAYVIVVDDIPISESNGAMLFATNNDAELEAAIEGLTAAFNLKLAKPVELKDAEFIVRSDSEIVCNWINRIYRFKQVSKMPKYEELMKLVGRLAAKAVWVEGHAGHTHNERCDKLANEARLTLVNGYTVQPKVKKPRRSKIGNRTDGTISIWFQNVLKIIDLKTNVVEDFQEEIHGKRHSSLSIN